MSTIQKIGLGGGCHWCTEAVFQSLKGVQKVEQGYISSTAPHTVLSEAVIVYFDKSIITLKDLIEVHLHTHKSTSTHSFRTKYRSAIYYFNIEDKHPCEVYIQELQADFESSIITLVLPFDSFKASREQIRDYYIKDPDRPFCKQYIHPKLQFLRQKYTRIINPDF